MKIYLKLEVDFADEEDVVRLARFTRPGEARACRDLLVQMWLYCKRNLTDGHVMLEQVGKLAYPDPPKVGVRDADRLVEVGIAERTPTGYYLPGYLKRNKSRAQVEEERARKAEAGRAGGIASGEARKTQAETKQSASEGLNTENREQRTENNVELIKGGERPVTLRASDASKPPTCQTHPDGDFDGPCGGCRKVREWHERVDKRTEQQLREQAAAALAACSRCDPDGWVLDVNGDATARKCKSHDVARRVSA